MTDRLSSLLHDETDVLDVPPAAVDRVLAGGRAIRRRRRTTATLIGAAAALGVLAIGFAGLGADRADRPPGPAGPHGTTAYQQLGAWAGGDEIHIGDHTATVPGVEYL